MGVVFSGFYNKIIQALLAFNMPKYERSVFDFDLANNIELIYLKQVRVK